MTSIIKALEAACQTAFTRAELASAYGFVRPSDRPDLAPFQCNGALVAANHLRQDGHKINPRTLAHKICAHLTDHPDIARTEIAGAGFINLTPSDTLFTRRAQELATDPHTGAQAATTAQTIIIDYGGANVAKPMHVGHLRSAVIGDCLKRLLRFRGHKVISDVHLGDWGLQMGHLITELAEEQPGLSYFDTKKTDGYPQTSPVSIDDLARLYPQASAKAKAAPERMVQSRTVTAQLQAGNPGYQALLAHFIAISITSLKQDYGRLGVEFDLWKGEASVAHLIGDVIAAFIQKGLAQDSDGALIVRVDEPDDTTDIPPVILRAASGAALYATTDLATLWDRKISYSPDKILYVVDQRQSQHFTQVFRATAKIGWFLPSQMIFLGFGTMNGEDGKPFKTREGGVLRLNDLLNIMRDSAHARFAEAGIGENLTPEQRNETAYKIGLAALKFADLQNQRLTNYVFNPQRFCAFEGKTGAYLLYACVRISSLLRRAEKTNMDEDNEIIITHHAERQLITILDGFERALQGATEKYAPHILCNHVYELAQGFSRFYAECPILATSIEANIRHTRLTLAEITLRQLCLGLSILGIETVEQM